MTVTAQTCRPGAPVALIVPGVSADGWSFADAAERVLLDLLAQAGFVVFVASFADVADGDGASGWGAPVPLAHMDAALTVVSAAPYHADVSRVAVLGWSEGGVQGLNWGWRNTDVCKAIVTFLSPPHVQTLYAGNGLIAALVDQAFDDNGGWAANRETHDPSSATNVALVEPIADRVQMFYSSNDGLAPEADHQTYAAATGVTVRSLGPISHSLSLTRPPWEWVTGWVLDRIAA